MSNGSLTTTTSKNRTNLILRKWVSIHLTTIRVLAQGKINRLMKIMKQKFNSLKGKKFFLDHQTNGQMRELEIFNCILTKLDVEQEIKK